MVHNKNKRLEGIRAANIDECQLNLRCVCCHKILLKPYQLTCCGNRICFWCFKKGLPEIEPFTCPFCQERQTRKQASADRGCERDLSIIIIICFACTWKGKYNDYLNHLGEKHNDLECPDCHERFFAVNPFEEHREELCIHRSLPCGVPNCAEAVKWNDMPAHYASIEHQTQLVKSLQEYLNAIDNSLKNERLHLVKDLNNILEIGQSVLTMCEKLEREHVRLTADVGLVKEIIQATDTKLAQLKSYNLENGKALKSLIDQVENTETQLVRISQFIETDQFTILDDNSAAILKFTCTDTKSFSMTSPKLQTSEFGYLFTIRVCSTHSSNRAYLSVFFKLHNSEYSTIIHYPFSYDIHLVLMDQSKQRKHIASILKPASNLCAFKRPITEANEEVGIVELCPLDYISSPSSPYIKDGTFFMGIFIDFLSTGETCF